MFKKNTHRTFTTNHMTKILSIAHLCDFELIVCSIKKEDLEYKIAASIEVDYEYLRATLNCNEEDFKSMYKDKRYVDMIHVLCHEAAHIITGELPDSIGLDYKGYTKHYTERATERVGRLIKRVYLDWIKSNKVNIATGE